MFLIKGAGGSGYITQLSVKLCSDFFRSRRIICPQMARDKKINLKPTIHNER